MYYLLGGPVDRDNPIFFQFVNHISNEIELPETPENRWVIQNYVKVGLEWKLFSQIMSIRMQGLSTVY